MSHPITLDSAGGEYMDSVVVLSWAVAPGDAVKAGEILVTVETAKAATEIVADRDGFLTAILYPEGAEAPVGAVLGTVGDSPQGVPPVAVARGGEDRPKEDGPKDVTPMVAPPVEKAARRVLATPLARRLARQAGIEIAEVPGTGPRGRIQKRDIRAWTSKPAGSGVAMAAPADEGADWPPVLDPVFGRRAPIVFLHGFAADRDSWNWILPLVDPARRVLALDLPGHGSQTHVAARTVGDLAAAVAAQLAERGISEAHLVGHSLGGGVTLALAAQGHLAVRSVCLLAPVGLGPEINGGFISAMGRVRTGEALKPWLSAMVGAPERLPPGYVEAVWRRRERQGNLDRLTEMAAHLFPDGTQAFDMRSALTGLRVPTRILWGKADHVVPWRHALGAPGRVGLHLFDGLGHVPQMEAPESVAAVIDELAR